MEGAHRPSEERLGKTLSNGFKKSTIEQPTLTNWDDMMCLANVYFFLDGTAEIVKRSFKTKLKGVWPQCSASKPTETRPRPTYAAVTRKYRAPVQKFPPEPRKKQMCGERLTTDLFVSTADVLDM
ncbi:hypothetical protein TNCV_1043771 [Trichonephila clavipes]|nr:hypothetical protein TNCV_1043771 [Trichonephila clavipes]